MPAMPTLQQRMADSTDPKVRREAMKSLTAFLRDDLDDLAMRKLWRSIFFGMWLADLAPVQAELAVHVGKTIHRFEAVASAARWLAAFCATVRGEWDRLDKYRVDKYYSLVRHVLREALAWCGQRAWDAAPVAAVGGALEAGFLASPAFPAGIKLHLADIVVDELCDARAPLEAARTLLGPYVALLRLTDEPLVSRVLDRVVANAAERARDVDGDGDERAKPLALFVQGAVYDVATDETTPQRFRSRLYAAVKALAAATGEKAVASKKRAADADPDDADAEEEAAAVAPPKSKPKPSVKQLKLKARKRIKQKAAFFQKKSKVPIKRA